jgi:hypothetical protein
MVQKSKRIVALILMAVFAFYYANICFSYHSHIINGTTIVHSHFYSKAHIQAGTHNVSELTLISALSVIQSLAAACCPVVAGIFLLIHIFIRPLPVERIIACSAAPASLRAPPSLF